VDPHYTRAMQQKTARLIDRCREMVGEVPEFTRKTRKFEVRGPRSMFSGHCADARIPPDMFTSLPQKNAVITSGRDRLRQKGRGIRSIS